MQIMHISWSHSDNSVPTCKRWGAWLAPLVKHVTLDIGIVSLSHMLQGRVSTKKFFLKKKEQLPMGSLEPALPTIKKKGGSEEDGLLSDVAIMSEIPRNSFVITN